METETIISSFGADIEVGTRSLDPGLSNLGRASLANTEDNVPGEGILHNAERCLMYSCDGISQRYAVWFRGK